MGESAFAKALGVSPQVVTNWKRRGMPARFHAKAAQVTDHTIEELLSGKESRPPGRPPLSWPFRFSRERFELLDATHRRLAELIIERFILAAEAKALGIDPEQVEAEVRAKTARRKPRAA